MDQKFDLVYLLIDHNFTIETSVVLQSQILDKIRVQHSMGLNVALITSVKDFGLFNGLIQDGSIPKNIKIFTFLDINKYHNILKAIKVLKNVDREYGIRWIYSRSIWSALAFRFFRVFSKANLIFDFRGDLVAESSANGDSLVKLVFLKYLVKMAIACSSVVLTVSNSSASFLKTNYDVLNPIVLPSAVYRNPYNKALLMAKEFRNSLGIIDDEIVLIYAGGTAHYQMLPQMLMIWKVLAAELNVRCILLTNKSLGNDSSINSLISLVPGIINLSVDRKEIPLYLGAADIGFILREQHQLNNVASPVKFAEYLAAGLAIVTSPGVGDISDLVQKQNLGTLINSNDLIQSVSACSQLIHVIRNNKKQFEKRSHHAFKEGNWDLNSHAVIWKKILQNNIN
jgi:hypothetical protein